METAAIYEAMTVTADLAALAIRLDNEPARDHAIQAGYYMESAHRAASVKCFNVADDLMGDAHRELVQARAYLAGMAQAVPVAA